MTFDATAGVNPEAAHGHYARRDGNVGIGEDQSVELETQPAFADEASRIAEIGEAARQVTAAREAAWPNSRN